jgi:hypothetical protein
MDGADAEVPKNTISNTNIILLEKFPLQGLMMLFKINLFGIECDNPINFRMI